ncbi:aerolysin family beta-barrel pore-forming toxin [Nannocystis punicea]|uniref:Aerolysin family beta-barrel pore-forming toxin n=1 Tax=Nannocystis punicea TaxID=2995304 RepID=A0ABY7H911_9BACT|nr:aerolysin family beta-barrel pore-forming toxin [Nannocystis poenicansa]WAS95753.1 aerolysin family beta-barrel pore-forming toxin [Nannocystis poenicansa]
MPNNTQYDFIIAKVRGPNNEVMALSVDVVHNDVVLAVHDYRDTKQMWEKRLRNANDEKIFGLVNRSTGKCIARASADNGAALRLVNAGSLGTDDLAAWQHDNVQGTYNALASVQDWEQKVNAAGNGPYPAGSRVISWGWDGGDDNELWRFLSANSSNVLKRIDFDLNAGTIADLDPSIVTQQLINNDSDVDQSQTLTYETKESKTETYEASAALELSVVHTVEVGAPVGFKTSLQLGAKVTTSITFGQSSTKEQTVSLTTPVVVPKRTSVTVKVLVRRGRIDMPFTATYECTYPDGTVVEVKKTGMYHQVSAYDVHTNIETPLPVKPSVHVGSTLEITNSTHLKQLGIRPDMSIYVHPNRDVWERWKVEDAGKGQVYLRSAAHGTFLGSRQDGSVYGTVNRDLWERWYILPVAPDLVLIRSAQWGLHLGARPDDSIYTHLNTYEWERWRLRSV